MELVDDVHVLQYRVKQLEHTKRTGQVYSKEYTGIRFSIEDTDRCEMGKVRSTTKTKTSSDKKTWTRILEQAW